MSPPRHIRVFKNGRNQAIRIPREMELPTMDATIRREGHSLIIEPVERNSLLDLLATMGTDGCRFLRDSQRSARPGRFVSVAVRRYLLHTNSLTDLIRNPAGRVRQRIIDVGETNVCTSIIVACEMRFGARKKNSPMFAARVERLLQTVEVIAFDAEADRAYADVRAALEAAGRPIGANDLLIAAHAVSEDCILVTNNESEFARVSGLQVEIG